jgi:hypothetical protein
MNNPCDPGRLSKPRWPLLVVVSCGALFLGWSTASADENNQSFRYDPPKNWIRGSQGGHPIFGAPDVKPPERCAIMLGNQVKLHGTFAEFFDEVRNGMPKAWGLKVLEAKEPKEATGAGDCQILSSESVLEGPGGARFWFLFSAAGLNETATSLIFLASSEELYSRHVNEVREMGAKVRLLESQVTEDAGKQAAPLANAEALDTAANAQFERPPGWARVESDGSILLTPSDAPDGKQCVLLINGKELALAGSFRDYFDGEVKTVVKSSGFKLIQQGEVIANTRPDGCPTLSLEMRLESATGAPTFLYFSDVQSGQLVSHFIFMAATEELYRAHLPEVKKLISAARFKAGLAEGAVASATKSEADLPANRLQGIYQDFWGKAASDAVISAMDPRLIFATSYRLTFFADGRVIHGLPDDGLLADFDPVRDGVPKVRLGAYEVDGDIVTIRWGGGDELVLQRQGQRLLQKTADGVRVYQRLPSCDGLKFDGAYARPAMELPAGVTFQPGAWTTPTLRFTAEGRFEEVNVLDTIGWRITQDDQRTALKRIRGGRGAYSIAKNTLLLRYDDGRVAPICFYIYPKELQKKGKEVLHINSFEFYRKD